MDERIRVGILMGGRSLEREISLASGRNLFHVLDRNRYDVYPIEIGLDGKWYLHHLGSPLLDPSVIIDADFEYPETYIPPSPDFSELVTARVMRSRIDILLLALHGPGGEDGTIQGFLETLEIPYVGSGVLASALTMDKGRCKIFLRAHNLPTPDWCLVSREEWRSKSSEIADKVLENFPQGCVVKPNYQGSSMGIVRLDPGEDPTGAIAEAFSLGEEVLVEKRIGGREFTCGVYGKDHLEALPVTEIKAPGGFFDYHSKYQEEGAEEITPAPIPETLMKQIQGLALEAHRLFGCAGITRTDFMLDEDHPNIIEINTIPGMTQRSLIPRACEAVGLSFDRIIERLIGETLFKDGMVPVA